MSPRMSPKLRYGLPDVVVGMLDEEGQGHIDLPRMAAYA